MSDEIKGLIEAQGRAFEEFKSTVNAEIEAKSKGSVDALFADKFTTLNASLDDISAKLAAAEKKSARPVAGASNMTDAQIEHKAAWRKWAADGEGVAELKSLEQKAYSISVNADGGFALPKEIDSMIGELLVDISPIRALSTVVTVGTTNYNKIVDINGMASGWVAETAARTTTNSSQFANISPTMGTLYANPAATQDSLDDAFFNLEAHIAQEIAQEFARAEGAAFIVGTGTNQPTGFTTGTPVVTADAARAFGVLQYVASGVAAAMPTTFDPFVDMVQALKAGHRAGASWVTNKAAIGSMRKLKESTGAFLWQPSMQAGVPDTFLGYPVVEAEDMPAVAASSFSVAFGNFKDGYLIADRIGVRQLRDPFTNKPYVQFYTTKRLGGIVQNSQAIKLLKCALT